MKHTILLLILTFSSTVNAQPCVWLPNSDTGCGYRSNPMDAESVADWLDCQIKGQDPIPTAESLVPANAPACNTQSDSCRDAWYAYGDVTGDYGVIDAAE